MIDGLRNSTGSGLIFLINEVSECIPTLDERTPRRTTSLSVPVRVDEETLIISSST